MWVNISILQYFKPSRAGLAHLTESLSTNISSRGISKANREVEKAIAVGVTMQGVAEHLISYRTNEYLIVASWKTSQSRNLACHIL